MHFTFVAYGARQEVERLLRDMESQKMKLRLIKEGEKDKHLYINGQVRLLPFGVMEYVFPREYRDIVINTMCNNTSPNRYSIPAAFKAILRKALKLEPLPKMKPESEKFLWCIEHVSILPIGIRKDWNLKEVKDMGYKGWNHEAI